MKVFPIIAWHLIRYHQLVYINRKYVSYLSLSIKVFGCNLFLTKFQHLYYMFLGKVFSKFLVIFNAILYQIILKQLSVTSITIFSVSFLSSSGTHHLKVIRDIPQHAWVFLNGFFTHALCFKVVRDPAKCFRHGMHYLVAHLLSYILIRNK